MQVMSLSLVKVFSTNNSDSRLDRCHCLLNVIFLALQSLGNSIDSNIVFYLSPLSIYIDCMVSFFQLNIFHNYPLEIFSPFHQKFQSINGIFSQFLYLIPFKEIMTTYNVSRHLWHTHWIPLLNSILRNHVDLTPILYCWETICYLHLQFYIVGR